MATTPLPSPDLGGLRRVSDSFEGAHPGDVLAWAAERFGDGLVVTISFQDALLAHLVATHAPRAEVVLLDTQHLFPETLAYAEDLRRRYDLRLTLVRPADGVVPDERWRDDPDGCCYLRKVEPLQRALAGRQAWVTGLRRADAPTRAGAPIVAWEAARRVVKVNPLAGWSDDDVARYAHAHDLPAHPLAAQGYGSIGCQPCTRPLAAGEDARAGRWAGTEKTECGLHA